jgi:diguanylate cyclase (GGDEF) domain
MSNRSTKSKIAKIRFHNHLKLFFFGDTDPKFVATQAEVAHNNNYFSLLFLSTIGTACWLFFSVFSLVIDFYKSMLILSLSALVFGLIFIAILLTVVRKNKSLSTAFFMIFKILSYLYVFLVSFVFFKDVVSPWFYVLMCLLPPLLFTYPYVHYITSGLMGIINIILCWLFKDQMIAIRETILTLLCVVSSDFVSFILMYQRTRALRLKNRIEYESNTDVLTGLPNKRAINLLIDEDIKGVKDKELISGVIMFDIDNFKQYNDEYGHIQGDNALELIGNELSLVAKKYNIFIGRYGGGEFIAFINFININNIDLIAKDIQDSIYNLKIEFKNNPNKNEHYITISLGVALTEIGDDPLDVINSADIALYKSKSAGRDQITIKNSIK